MKADAVFEGGGIRGIAFAGAIQAMEEQGVQWERVAGTSVGSIIAALLAAGYSSEEITEEMYALDFQKLKGKTMLNYIPLVGNLLNVVFHLGMYQNDYLEKWIGNRLEQKNIRTFADLPAEKLKIIASDISNGKMLIFPDDLARYGMKSSDVLVSKAIMMSTSIPFFYRPVRWKLANRRKAYIVDGGLLSNFPVWLFDAPEPRFPTFGFRFSKDDIEADVVIPTPLHLAQNMVKTMLQAHDLRYLNTDTKNRTIQINTNSISATDFALSEAQAHSLFNSGYQAATLFLAQWDFQQYKRDRLTCK